jgi:hypothetical protein
MIRGRSSRILAVTLALGGDCLADIAMLRAEPALFGPVASDFVVSRLVSGLAGDAPRALKAIRAARAAARERAWPLAGESAPGAGGGRITVDIDATIVTACSDTEQARPTWKRTFGFHPLAIFADHGPDGGGGPRAKRTKPASPMSAAWARPGLTRIPAITAGAANSGSPSNAATPINEMAANPLTAAAGRRYGRCAARTSRLGPAGHPRNAPFPRR